MQQQLLLQQQQHQQDRLRQQHAEQQQQLLRQQQQANVVSNKVSSFNENAEILALLTNASAENKERIKKMLQPLATSSDSNSLMPDPPNTQSSLSLPSIIHTNDEAADPGWTKVGEKSKASLNAVAAGAATAQPQRQQQPQQQQKASPRRQPSGPQQNQQQNPKNHHKYGLIVGHNIDKKDIKVHQALVKIVLENKPEGAQVNEIKLTRKEDILVIAKSDHDFNLLLKSEKWNQSVHRFFPRLGIADNLAKVAYVKDVDHETDPEIISKILTEKNISHCNIERVVTGPDKSPTTSVRLILHSQSDLENLCKSGILFDYKNHAVERHTKVKVIQCNSCGKHGHIAANCLGTARCIKCGTAGHKKDECTEDAATITCYNCNGNHAGNFGGCKEKLKIHRNERRKTASYADITRQPSQATSSTQHLAQHPQQQHAQHQQNHGQTGPAYLNNNLNSSPRTSNAANVRRSSSANILAAAIEIVTTALKEANPVLIIPQDLIFDTTMRITKSKYPGMFDHDLLTQQLMTGPPQDTTDQTIGATAAVTSTANLASCSTSNMPSATSMTNKPLQPTQGTKRGLDSSLNNDETQTTPASTCSNAASSMPRQPDLLVNGLPISTEKSTTNQSKAAKKHKTRAVDHNSVPVKHKSLPPSPEVVAEMVEFGTPGDQPTAEQLSNRRKWRAKAPPPPLLGITPLSPSPHSVPLQQPLMPVMNLLQASENDFQNGFLIPGATAVKSICSSTDAVSQHLMPGQSSDLTTMALAVPLPPQNGL